MQAKESQNSRAQDEVAEENKADQKALTAQHIFSVSFEISENLNVRNVCPAGQIAAEDSSTTSRKF